jgi:3-dehydroquinate synthase
VAVRYVLARSCQIKACVVEEDPLDRGARGVLNYGHTVGHALEVAAGEWALRHGEAVAIGMVAEARLGEELGLTEPGTGERLARLLLRAGLPTGASGVDCTRAEEALLQDKKIAAGSLRLPYVPRIGEVALTQEVPVSALRDAVRWAVAANGAGGRDGET